MDQLIQISTLLVLYFHQEYFTRTYAKLNWITRKLDRESTSGLT